jgi:hypothetical protein
MWIKDKIEQKAMDKQQSLATQAQAKYIGWLMKEEQCDYNEAIAIVMGNTDPIEPEYMLGYKLSDPVWMIAIFKQAGKKNRVKAALNFSELLSDAEKEIFWNEVFDEQTGRKFKRKLKEEKKKMGISDDSEDVD